MALFTSFSSFIFHSISIKYNSISFTPFYSKVSKLSLLHPSSPFRSVSIIVDLLFFPSNPPDFLPPPLFLEFSEHVAYPSTGIQD